jgi:peroxiredoxin Q/BCP
MKTITEGTRVPDFELPDQDGVPTRLSDQLAKGPVVLFFYPMAMTSGCTKEACHFRDLAAEFADAGAQRLGISVDTVAKQKEFAIGNGFDYPLLSDESGAVATSFGVRRKYVTPVKRATFVIDRDLTVAKVITSEMNMDVHADQALAAVRAL